MPDSVSENNEVKLLWDMNIQHDHVTEAKRPDIGKNRRESAPLSILLWQGIRELVKRRMRRLKSIRSLKDKLQGCGT